MEEEQEKILKAIKEAAASVRMEHLPLSDEFIENYTRKRIDELNNKKRMILKRGVQNAK